MSAAQTRTKATDSPSLDEYSIVGSLLMRPALFASIDYLARSDFIDPRHGDAFEAMRAMHLRSIPHEHFSPSTVADFASEGLDLSPNSRDTYARQLALHLNMVAHDCGHRTGLETEAKVVRMRAIKRQRKAAAAREDWEEIERLNKAAVEFITPRALTMTAAELWNKEFPPLKWLIHDVLPEGVTLLCSPPKIGKTRLATQLSIAVATGGYALNNPDSRAENTGVLFLALESGDRRAQKDLKQLSDTAPEGLHIASTWARLSEGGMNDLERWLDQHPGVKLIVIDTLAKVRDRGHGGKGFMYSADYDANSAIKSMADARGVSVVLIHHSNKSKDADDALDSVSGSTGVTGSVDHIILLKRRRLEPDGLLTLISRDHGDRAWAMRFESGLWTLVGTPDEAADQADWNGDGESDARQQILSLLRKEPLSPADIAERLGKNRTTTRRLLMKLAESGKVNRRMDGKYSVESVNSVNTVNSVNSVNTVNSTTFSVAVHSSGEREQAVNSTTEGQPIEIAVNDAVHVHAVHAVHAVHDISESPPQPPDPDPVATVATRTKKKSANSLLSSPMATRMAARVEAAGPAGIDEKELEREGKKSGPALYRMTLDALVKAHQWTRCNGRWIAGSVAS